MITDSWPGQMRTVWGDHEPLLPAPISPPIRDYYFTGDGCRRDEDGYYWITGRIDDVINVSGHRLGTAEIESALVAHEDVAEAAVVGMPHDIKGQGIYAYVTVNAGCPADEGLRAELVRWVRSEIGPIATPDIIQFAPALPKTRSGKIMRRILRKIAEGDVSNLGDTSTLADPAWSISWWRTGRLVLAPHKQPKLSPKFRKFEAKPGLKQELGPVDGQSSKRSFRWLARPICHHSQRRPAKHHDSAVACEHFLQPGVWPKDAEQPVRKQ